MAALCQLTIFALSGFDGRSLLFLLVAETLAGAAAPPLPFVSNHGVDDQVEASAAHKRPADA